MKVILKKITLALTALLLLSGVTLALTAQPAAAVNTAVCKGVGITDGAGDECTEGTDTENSFSAVIKRVINIFSIVVGAVSVIMIIIGGFRYIVSNGDSNGVQGAKNTILYAIVGLVIVLFAQIIVRFVLTNVATSA